MDADAGRPLARPVRRGSSPTVDRQDQLTALDQEYPFGYCVAVYQLQSTEIFDQWLRNLQDRKGLARILARLESAQLGNLGDVKAVGGGIREMRVHVGPGYRVYFVQTGRVLLLLLCGGDKSTQVRDIAKARHIRRGLGKE
jgi:putative addiction module killer protein